MLIGSSTAEIIGTYKGTVISGEQQARKLNVPTANIEPKDFHLKGGVYACIVKILESETEHHSMCYTDDRRSGLLEAHILDWDSDLYGKKIQITVLKKLRDPEEYKSFNYLLELINNDLEQTRLYFKKQT